MTRDESNWRGREFRKVASSTEGAGEGKR